MFNKSILIPLLFIISAVESKDHEGETQKLSISAITTIRTSFEYCSNILFRQVLGKQIRAGLPSQAPVYPMTLRNFLQDRNAGFCPRFAKIFTDNWIVTHILSSEKAIQSIYTTPILAGCWQFLATPLDSLIIQRTIDAEKCRLSNSPLRSYLSITKELGMKNIFRGASMNISASLTTWSFFLWYTNRFVTSRFGESYDFHSNIQDAFFAAIGETVLFSPFWNMRTYMQQYPSTSILKTLLTKYKAQGVKGFYFGGNYAFLYALVFTAIDFRILFLQQQKGPHSNTLPHEPSFIF